MTNNNLLLKIYCENIVKILQWHFSIRIFYFLYYFSFLHFTLSHTFHSFFLFFFLFFSSTHVSTTISTPFFYYPFLPPSEHSRGSILSFFLRLSLFLSLSFFFFLLDSKTLSAIRKFSFSPSFKNIPGSSHLRAVAHFRPQPNPYGSALFYLLSFFFFAFIVMIWLILKLCFWICILIIWLYLSLEMFEGKIVVFVVFVL